MSKLFVSEHPLIHTKMAMLRNKETGTKEFREIIGEVASLLFYEATREHNDANILAMGARVTGAGLALEIVKAFLETPFSNDERHIRRINQIED